MFEKNWYLENTKIGIGRNFIPYAVWKLFAFKPEAVVIVMVVVNHLPSDSFRMKGCQGPNH
jgi:hypothetical protein